MTRPNLYEATFSYDASDPEGYRTAEALTDAVNVGALAGGRDTAVRLFAIPAGQSLCPYHYEYVEEWLLLISGALELRTPAGTEPLKAGDLVAFPTGAQGAHKVTATGSEPARLLMWSAKADPEVCVYPDSDKVWVATGNKDDRFSFFRKDTHVEYYDGEL